MNKPLEIPQQEQAARRAARQPDDAGATPVVTPPKKRGRRMARHGILVFVVAIAALFGSQWVMARWSRVSINDARIAASLVTVSSEVSGRVIAIPVSVGETVASGSPLVSIDPEQASLLVAGIDAQLAGNAARSEQLRTQQGMIRVQIDSRKAAARAGIAAAEANDSANVAALHNARSRFDRVNELASRNVATEQDLEDSQTALETAHQQELATSAAVATARANLAVIEADAGQIGVIDQQIETLNAERNGLEAERGQKVIDLTRRKVTAAFDGVVDATFVDAGEYVTPGTRLLIYHHPNQTWVDANVKETDFRRISLGAPATIEVDAYPDREFHGTVVRIGRAATSQFALLPSPNPSGNFTKVTQRLPLRVSIDSAGATLSPGMMVEMNIDVGN